MSAHPTSYRPAVPHYAPPMNMPQYNTINNKLTNINICSLNCRSLSKPTNATASQDLSRFLCSQHFDILCLQETHATDINTQERLDIQLQAQQSIWTPHCGIVSRNHNIHLESLYISTDQRVILGRVSHVNKLFPSFTIMNIYAPAKYRERYNFYANLLSSEYFSALISDIYSTELLNSNFPSMIVGDFNYHFRHFPYNSIDQYLSNHAQSLSFPQQPTQPTPATTPDTEQFTMPQLDSNDPTLLPPSSIAQWVWHWIMTQHFVESSHKLQSDPYIPTFRRAGTLTTIDYMFLHPVLAATTNASRVQYLHNEWTDHALLSVQLRFDNMEHGQGIWRANPSLATYTYFVEQLNIALDDYHCHLATLPEPQPAQISWDQIKALTKSLVRRIGRNRGAWRQRQLKRLQRKRNKFLRIYKETRVLNERLPIIEHQIGILQQEIVDNLALRSGLRWRENGDTSAGVLKRIVQQTTRQRTLPDIIHPVTGDACETPQHKQEGVKQYYQHLYAPSPISSTDTQFFTSQIPPSDKLPDDKHDTICAAFNLTDIQEGSLRSPHKSSPGPDGLPYEILTILFQHPATGKLALQVYNEALALGIFPTSWLETCMILLPKKGDLSQLSNWRPISLINADAKIFTRLINTRLMIHMNKYLSTNQMGFMPNRFIGEQGLILQCLQEISHQAQSDTIALLLDQQKAYDRIHFDYLQECMQAFNIPSKITQSIVSLFSSTMIQVNVNGFLTSHFQQRRGLRQGDPISPLLFNIAFDPLLRSIHNSSKIQGFNLQKEATPRFDNHAHQITTSLEKLTIQSNHPTNYYSAPLPPDTTVKIIAYADDTLVTLKNQDDFMHLQTILTKYMNASNALLNYSKTQALSLSGSPHPEWQAFLQQQGIHHWHDKNSPEPLIYLGYAICSSPNQRAAHAQKTIANMKLQCRLFTGRSVTYRGKVTIMNSLIYSKIWHMIRLFSFSKSEMNQLQQIAASFINNNAKVSRFSFDTLTLPRQQGGLQLIDPQQQSLALQWRWLQYLLHPTQPSPTHMPSIPIIRFTLHYILSTSEFPTYHWSLLFPHCRPIIPRTHGPIVNLLRAADHITNPMQYCSTDITTCLQLPLIHLFLPQVLPHHPNYEHYITSSTIQQHIPNIRQLRGSDIFFFNNDTLSFEYHQDLTQLPHRHTSKKVLLLIQNNQLTLHKFVLHHFVTQIPRTIPTLNSYNNNINALSSFLLSKISNQFNTENFSFIVSPPTTSGFKSLPSPAKPPPSTVLSPAKWQQFWRIRIPLNARNTWYRFLHRKITTRERLHELMPDTFDPYCPLCPRRRNRRTATHKETNQHFMFACPKKLPIWTTAICTYVDPNYAHFNFLHLSAILKLDSTIQRTTTVPFQSLSIYQVFACIIQAIWIAHYRFIFADIPFVPLAVLSTIHKNLTKLNNEENLHLES